MTDSVRRAESRNPDLALVHDVSGLLKAHWGFYEDAAAEYRRAIELNPEDGDAYRRLGASYQSNNQFDEALIAFKKAVEVQPNYFKPYQSLGTFYIRRAKFEEAVAAYQKMVALAPDLSEAHLALGVTYSRLGRLSDAEKELRVSIGLQETAQAGHALAEVLMYEGRDQEAISFYLRALSVGPESAGLWLDLGVSYDRAGRRTEAQSAFRRGLVLALGEIARDPRNGGARAEMAYSYARLGDSQRAETEAAQAVRFSPNDKHTRWMAVATYERIGLREQTLALLGSTPLDMLPGLLAQLNRYPEMAGLRTDPRFIQLRGSHPVQ
jgi:Flp pilus assembly protein TadD